MGGTDGEALTNPVIIESLSHPAQRYVGYTSRRMDLRLKRHNDGTTPATAHRTVSALASSLVWGLLG